MIYGRGGSGKTHLAHALPNPVWVNADGDPYVKAKQLPLDNWQDVTHCLADESNFDPFDSIVMDTATVLQDWAAKHIVGTIKGKEDVDIESLEKYAWGKGWQFLYEHFNDMLAQLDRLVRGGKNVCLICHDVVGRRVDPMGVEVDEYQPRLFPGTKGGKSSIQNRVQEWCSQMLFVRFNADGVRREVHLMGGPAHWGKSRTIRKTPSVEFLENGGPAIWQMIWKGDATES